jgi:hypothetical protein
MNIALYKLGDYMWSSPRLSEDLGVIMEHIVPEDTRSPCYSRVCDKQKFFLAVVKYGIVFKELSDDDMERMKADYLQESARRRNFFYASWI